MARMTTLLLVLASCSGPPPEATTAKRTEAQRFVALPMMEEPWLPRSPESPSAALALADEPAAPPAVQRLHGPTACRTAGNTALWVRALDSRPPRVDAWFALVGHRSTTPVRTDPPIEAAWLIGHEREEPPISTPFAPGCWLLVRPFAMLFCYDRDPAAPPPLDKRTAGWRSGTHAYLIIRPEPALLGRSLFVQLAARSDQNMAGVIVSAALELRIGG